MAYVLPGAFAFDAHGGPGTPTNVYTSVDMELLGDAASGFVVVLRPLAGWLHAPDRVFPVTIDPTIVASNMDAMNLAGAVGPVPEDEKGLFHPLPASPNIYQNTSSPTVSVTLSPLNGNNGLPTDISLVSSLLITVLAYSSLANYATIHPTGSSTNASMMNFRAGTWESTQVVVALNAAGSFTLDSGTSPFTFLFVQVNGWFDYGTTPIGALRFTPSDGIRSGVQTLSATTPALKFQIGGVRGVPTDISAVTINVTTGNAAGVSGWLDVIPQVGVPGLASLGYINTAVPWKAHSVTVPVGSDGAVYVRGSSMVGAATVYLDVLGWYRSAGGTTTAGTGFRVVTPYRIVDTRQPVGVLNSVGSKVSTYTFKVADPGTAKAVALSVVAFDAAQFTWMNATAKGAATTDISNLTLPANDTIQNIVTTPVSADGYVTLQFAGGIAANVIVDVFGFYGWAKIQTQFSSSYTNEMLFGDWDSTSSAWWMSFVKSFPNTFRGKRITSAKLNLKINMCDAQDAAPYSTPIQVYRNSGAFFYGMSGLPPVDYTSVRTSKAAGPGTIASFDITTFAQGWAANTATNYGLAIRTEPMVTGAPHRRSYCRAAISNGTGLGTTYEVTYTDTSVLESDTALMPETSLISPNGLYVLVNPASDGNITIYNTSTNQGVWQSGTRLDPRFPGVANINADARLEMNGNGNLFLWRNGNATDPSWRNIWQAVINPAKGPIPGSYLRLTDDGDLVIYKPDTFTGIPEAIWRKSLDPSTTFPITPTGGATNPSTAPLYIPDAGSVDADPLKLLTDRQTTFIHDLYRYKCLSVNGAGVVVVAAYSETNCVRITPYSALGNNGLPTNQSFSLWVAFGRCITQTGNALSVADCDFGSSQEFSDTKMNNDPLFTLKSVSTGQCLEGQIGQNATLAPCTLIGVAALRQLWADNPKQPDTPPTGTNPPGSTVPGTVGDSNDNLLGI